MFPFFGYYCPDVHILVNSESIFALTNLITFKEKNDVKVGFLPLVLQFPFYTEKKIKV